MHFWSCKEAFKLLPQAFIDSIQDLLLLDGHPEEVVAFIEAQNQPSARGLRANRLRVKDRDTLNRLLSPDLGCEDLLLPVAWSSDGLYYPADKAPAGLVAYHAGLYYIQEPSAMLPAELLGTRPGERILDLCAAPGGKSCQIAAELAGEGLLWANDISADRVRPLIRNLELMGCTNAVVSEETPERLASVLPLWFDRVLVDAPCSGAGMFRRDGRALAGFSAYDPAQYVATQAQILAAADLLLKPGGILVYSTCTFATAENECQIADFMARHPSYRQMPVAMKSGLSEGLPVNGAARIGIRIWPHRANGDGHFCAVLVKGREDTSNKMSLACDTGSLSGLLVEPPAGFQRFLSKTLSEQGQERMASKLAAILRLREGHLHSLPMASIPAGGLHIIKTGLYLGDLRSVGRTDPESRKTEIGAHRLTTRTDRSERQKEQDRRRPGVSCEKPPIAVVDGLFTPSHALSHVLLPTDLQYVLTSALESQETRRFIRGETLMYPDQGTQPPDGAIVGIAADQYLLGFTRQMPDGHLKNLYPPAWRKHS